MSNLQGYKIADIRWGGSCKKIQVTRDFCSVGGRQFNTTKGTIATCTTTAISNKSPSSYSIPQHYFQSKIPDRISRRSQFLQIDLMPELVNWNKELANQVRGHSAMRRWYSVWSLVSGVSLRVIGMGNDFSVADILATFCLLIIYMVGNLSCFTIIYEFPDIY